MRAELDAAWAAVVVPFGKQKDPIAVTPTAQVHVDEVDGEPVAVKVARPGVAAQIRSELALLDTLAVPLRSIFRSLDVSGVMREVRETVMDELDLEHEGEQQQRVRRALRRLDGVVVPEVFIDECAPGPAGHRAARGRGGAGGSRACRRVADRRAPASRGATAGSCSPTPRPSHLIFLADGDLGLLGTGLARPHDRDRLAPFVTAFAALTEKDPAAFVVGGRGARAARRRGRADRARAAARDPRPVRRRARPGSTLRHCATSRSVPPSASATCSALAAGVTPDPRDIHAARMLGQLSATLARFGVTADWPALAARAASA